MTDITRYHKTVITNAIVANGYWSNDNQCLIDDAIEDALDIMTGRAGQFVSLLSVSYVTITISGNIYLAVTVVAEAAADD